MFVSKKKFDALVERVVALEKSDTRQTEAIGDVRSALVKGDLIDRTGFFVNLPAYPIVFQFKRLLEHLGLEYQESVRSGYVKKGKK